MGNDKIKHNELCCHKVVHPCIKTSFPPWIIRYLQTSLKVNRLDPVIFYFEWLFFGDDIDDSVTRSLLLTAISIQYIGDEEVKDLFQARRWVDFLHNTFAPFFVWKYQVAVEGATHQWSVRLKANLLVPLKGFFIKNCECGIVSQLDGSSGNSI